METITAEQYHAGEISDMKIKRLSERDLQSEIKMFGGKTSEEVVDAFEEERGIKSKKEKRANIVNDVQIFDISIPRDKKLYQQLINNPRYEIIAQKDNFNNVSGRYTVVCYYTEDLDSASPAVEISVEED